MGNAAETVMSVVRRMVAAKSPAKAVPDVSMDSAFQTDLHCDAIDMVCICLDVEDALGIVLPPDEAEQSETVGDLAKVAAGVIGS